MKTKIDTEILNNDTAICQNIDKFNSSERGLLSQNILSHLRNFVESIALKIYANGKDIDNNYQTNIKPAVEHIKKMGNLNFIAKFHHFLQISVSHYTLDEENSERLMLKYYEYLLKIKKFMKDKYNITVLRNIELFPINTDSDLKEYYEKIADKIKWHRITSVDKEYNERYYIKKIKPFFVGGEIYYEVTFIETTNITSKFDRAIAFTKLDISKNYAVRLSIYHNSIEIMGKTMPILIIGRWEVSIRPCEFNHFSEIFGEDIKISSKNTEYRNIMRFLTKIKFNLIELIEFDDYTYNEYKKSILEQLETVKIFNILDKCRDFIKNDRAGSNVIKYLLYHLNNNVIKIQINKEKCTLLSNLYLKFGCIPFDEMPFNSSLVKHNPKLVDLFDCIDTKNREHELFARHIRNNTEQKCQLYTPRKEIINIKNIDAFIEKYNSILYSGHQNRRLENYKDNIYIKDYEEDTQYIIKKLSELSTEGIEKFSDLVISWLNLPDCKVDCEEKKDILTKMFEKSNVALIYGSAGTGKSTLINHISDFFNDKKKIYLANTNPAVDNLKRKVYNSNKCSFKTIAKFLSYKNYDIYCDLLVIDECSTVSNEDMRKILKKAKFEQLLLVGDIYQIESITFGNWFSLSKKCIPETSIFELTTPYRAKNNKKLLDLWNRVRNIEDTIIEHITKNNYSTTFNESIFEKTDDDEIVLCLNYDGLYGINNLNRFLQENNKNSPVRWGLKTYKINDPILFNESERFAPLIYNNLKGKIVDIKIIGDEIQFDIELEKNIDELYTNSYDFTLVGNSKIRNSIIRFSVNKYKSSDEDNTSSSDIVPFQVAYAVSIHKAQGLEYNSVKIVITEEVDELITHNIFYTAITRAKEKLKIYWTPETENKILNGFKHKINDKDFYLLRDKYGLGEDKNIENYK